MADTFEELTARRPYKTVLSLSETTARLRELSGRELALDPACVDAFLQGFGQVREIQQRYADHA